MEPYTEINELIANMKRGKETIEHTDHEYFDEEQLVELQHLNKELTLVAGVVIAAIREENGKKDEETVEIERYLKMTTHRYKIYNEFVKDQKPHVIVTEFTPSGEESRLYVLYQDGNRIVNGNGRVCAKINGVKIETVEG